MDGVEAGMIVSVTWTTRLPKAMLGIRRTHGSGPSRRGQPDDRGSDATALAVVFSHAGGPTTVTSVPIGV
jgi:hypothetical protein